MVRRFKCLFVLLLVLLQLVGCGINNNAIDNEKRDESLEKKESVIEKKESATKIAREAQIESEQTESITLSAVGDVLIHSSVWKDAWDGNTYDFTPMFQKVNSYLSNATVTIANQETVIGGSEIGLSGYPRFNSPVEIGDALQKTGVDVVSVANNHTLDRGEEAIHRALAHWEEIDMLYTGAHSTQEESDRLCILHTNQDIDIAFLSYTYGTNGIPVPEGKDYLVNVIDKNKIALDVERAEALADVVIVSLHYGNEYERMPNEEQRNLVQYIADLGVHAIIGHHPHVLQPIEWVKGKEENRTLVAYSLGNFLSAQDKIYRRIGGMIRFTIEKTTKSGRDEIAVKEPEFLPTYVYYKDWKNYSIIPMYQLTNEELPEANVHYEEIKKHMSQYVPELSFIEK